MNMAHFHRFGRRKPLPSTLAISHDLRALWADETARSFCAEADGLPNTASWDEIVVRRGELAVASKGSGAGVRRNDPELIKQ
jgi:hypothetical protein